MESGTPKKTKKPRIDQQHGTKDSNIVAQTVLRTKEQRPSLKTCYARAETTKH
jgi:hypothetical protein